MIKSGQDQSMIAGIFVWITTVANIILSSVWKYRRCAAKSGKEKTVPKYRLHLSSSIKYMIS